MRQKSEEKASKLMKTCSFGKTGDIYSWNTYIICWGGGGDMEMIQFQYICVVLVTLKGSLCIKQSRLFSQLGVFLIVVFGFGWLLSIMIQIINKTLLSLNFLNINWWISWRNPRNAFSWVIIPDKLSLNLMVSLHVI